MIPCQANAQNEKEELIISKHGKCKPCFNVAKDLGQTRKQRNQMGMLANSLTMCAKTWEGERGWGVPLCAASLVSGFPCAIPHGMESVCSES